MKTKTEKLFIALLVMCVVTFPILAGCAAKPVSPTAKAVPTVIVGCIAALSGPTSLTHIWCCAGSDNYLNYVNEKKGGIEGAKGKVKVIYKSYDSQYVASKAKDGFAMLQGLGMIVHTHCGAGHSDALMADYEAAKIPLVTGSLGTKSAWSDWCYNTYHSGAINMPRSWTKWVKSEWEKAGKPGGTLKVGTLITSDEPGPPMAMGGFGDWAKANGVDWAAEETSRLAVDVTPQLLRLKKAGCYQIYVICTVSPTGVVIIKSAKAMGLDIPITISLMSMPGDCITVLGKELAEGVQCESPIEPMMQKGTSPGLELVRQVFAEYHLGTPPMDMFVNGFICGMVIEKAISLALDEVAPAQLNGETLKIHGLDRIRDFDAMGLCNRFSYVPGDHVGPKAIKFWVIRGGALEPLSGWAPASTDRIPLPK